MTSPELYPLKFTPILKSPLWGGTKLGSRLNKDTSGLEICGESWEISGVDNNISVVMDGPLQGRNLEELIEVYKNDLVGENVYAKYGSKFPLLVKFIDANQDLSIQVHPDDELAMKRHNSFGKTEMWYVIEADENASLISGFNKATNKEEYLNYFNSGRLISLLNQENVVADDVYYLPAGRVHTIGKGLLIAEIQQTSDVTYRIFDFDRVDKDGNSRELHVDEAIEAIDYNFYDQYKTSYDRSSAHAKLIESAYFVTNRILTENELVLEYSSLDSFKILMFLDGEGSLESTSGRLIYQGGDTFLVPACIDTLSINPEKKSKILEVYLPS